MSLSFRLVWQVPLKHGYLLESSQQCRSILSMTCGLCLQFTVAALETALEELKPLRCKQLHKQQAASNAPLELALATQAEACCRARLLPWRLKRQHLLLSRASCHLRLGPRQMMAAGSGGCRCCHGGADFAQLRLALVTQAAGR